jgi:hypothetical protein
VIWLLCQTPVPVSNPAADQLLKDGNVVGWALFAVMSCLIGVVGYLIRSIATKDQLYVETMKEFRQDSKEFQRDMVLALKDNSDSGRKAAEAMVARIDSHTQTLASKLDTNHREIVEKLQRRREDT